MKHLYENIENIYIKGGPDILTEAITNIDLMLQNIAGGTEQLAGILLKYSNSNKGYRYQAVINTLCVLRAVLSQASLEMNQMQNEVVLFQNKIYRYEGLAETGVSPNEYLVREIMVDVDTSSTQFSRDEMIEVHASLTAYSEAIRYYTGDMVTAKNQLGAYWIDPQYNDFSDYIDEVVNYIESALKDFDDYVLALQDAIKELS